MGEQESPNKPKRPSPFKGFGPEDFDYGINITVPRPLEDNTDARNPLGSQGTASDILRDLDLAELAAMFGFSGDYDITLQDIEGSQKSISFNPPPFVKPPSSLLNGAFGSPELLPSPNGPAVSSKAAIDIDVDIQNQQQQQQEEFTFASPPAAASMVTNTISTAPIVNLGPWFALNESEPLVQHTANLPEADVDVDDRPRPDGGGGGGVGRLAKAKRRAGKKTVGFDKECTVKSPRIWQSGGKRAHPVDNIILGNTGNGNANTVRRSARVAQQKSTPNYGFGVERLVQTGWDYLPARPGLPITSEHMDAALNRDLIEKPQTPQEDVLYIMQQIAVQDKNRAAPRENALPCVEPTNANVNNNASVTTDGG